ncbi:MAG: tyrosine-type recombinase/integrase [Verrucomicrobiota bacterium]
MSDKNDAKNTTYQKIKGIKGLYKNTTTNKDGKKGVSYYVRLLWRQEGKGYSKWKSLRTDKLSIAKQRAIEAQMRHDAEKGRVNHDLHDVTLRDIYGMYIRDVQGNPDFKPKSKEARVAAAKRLMRAWPEMADRKMSTLSKAECERWVRKVKTIPIGKAPPGTEQEDKLLSSSAINKTIGALKHLTELAITIGVRADDPALRVKRAKERTEKKVNLPSIEEMDKLLVELEHPQPEKILSLEGAQGSTQAEQAESLGISLATFKRHLRKNQKGPKLKAAGEGRNRDAGDCARLLMFTGVRIGEAQRLQWKHVNWTKNQLHIPGTKSNAANRIVPLVPEGRAFLKQLFDEHQPDFESPILRRKNIQKAIDGACERLGLARMTHHDFRHYFITTCVESGIDFKTIAEWVGHSDGGILIGKVYGHLRDQHSQESAAKVSFGQKKPSKVVDFRTG